MAQITARARVGPMGSGRRTASRAACVTATGRPASTEATFAREPCAGIRRRHDATSSAARMDADHRLSMRPSTMNHPKSTMAKAKVRPVDGVRRKRAVGDRLTTSRGGIERCDGFVVPTRSLAKGLGKRRGETARDAHVKRAIREFDRHEIGEGQAGANALDVANLVE